MNIKNVSQRLLGIETYIGKEEETSKVAKAGINQTKDTFEKAKPSDQSQSRETVVQQSENSADVVSLRSKVASEAMRPANVAIGESRDSKKELSFDQANLAGRINFDTVARPEYGVSNGRKQHEEQLKDKNAYNDGVKFGTGSSSEKDLQERFNAERGLTGPAEQPLPTGPDISSTLNRLMENDYSLENRQAQIAEQGGKEARGQTASELREGATGNALLESTDDHERKANPYGKESIAQGIGYNVPSNSDDVKGGSGDAAKNHPGLARFVEETYVKGGSSSPRAEMLKASEDDGTLKADGTKVGKDGTKVETGSDGSKTVTKPDGSSTTVYPDGSYVDKDPSGKTTDKGSSIEQPDEESQFVSPEQLGLLGWKQITPGLFHTHGNRNDGVVDPSDDAGFDVAVSADVANALINSKSMQSMVGMPAPDETGQVVNSSRGFTGSPQNGGEICFDDYNGPTRAEDPADVDFNVGGEPLIPLGSQNEEDEEEEQKASSKKGYRYLLNG